MNSNNHGPVLSAASAGYLRTMTQVGLGVIEKQRERHHPGYSYHGGGFAQDVFAEDGTLLHCELTDDGFWKITVADTGRYVSLFIPNRDTT